MGGDLTTSASVRTYAGFNPRPRMGGDVYKIVIESKQEVSIHAPAWGATFGKARTYKLLKVSIHAPAWGATLAVLPLPISISPFQSTPPHGGRHCQELCVLIHQSVSIHAPAWGATFVGKSFPIKFPVSIHAPAWGATMDSIYFTEPLRVSIHAPAWGATRTRSQSRVRVGCFNPRPRMGGDLAC
ncbi:hypothetical cytosolic protein [Syntrophus aciditrophicus SB]|nr:hypothetical cytosolic protein [Syntrophus aciditrophicus SB]